MYYKAMYNTSLRILKDSFEAEDVMQESFLIAFTKLSTFKAEVSFGSWLKKIVINKSITHLRRNSKITEVPLENIKEQPEEHVENENYEMLSPKEIINGINELKDNYRIVLTLKLIEGYDYEEISQIMDITNQNCRTTISRAKNKLRKILNSSYAK